MLEHLRVVSSTVVSVGYDPANEVLEVLFRNGLYEYYGFPSVSMMA